MNQRLVEKEDLKYGLGEMKPYYCKGDYILLDKNGNITSMRRNDEAKDNCVLNKDAKFPCKAYDECLEIQGTNKPLPCVVNWMMGRPFENMLRNDGDDS